MKKSLLKISWGMLFRACEDSELSDGACRLHTRILSLSRKEGYSWANNAFFARELNISKASVSRRVSELCERGYIRIEIDKQSGNKRHIYPIDTLGTHDIFATTSAQECGDPLDNNDDTSLQISTETINAHVDTSSQQLSESLCTDAQHNKADVTMGIERNKGEQSSVIVFQGSKNETLSEEDSERTRFAPYGEAELNGLLRSGRKLAAMNADEQVQVVIAFCCALGEPMNNLLTYAKRISGHIRRGGGAERLMHAIWNFHHSDFGQNYKGKLNYLLGDNTQKRIDNAIDDAHTFYFVAEHKRTAALAFNPLLEKDFRDLHD